MNIRRFKLRFRRNVRKHKRQVEGIGVEAERQLENNFLRRLHRLGPVRKFVTIWLLVVLLLGLGIIIQTRALSGYYQRLQPVPGGIYSEGILGAYTNANPVYASGGVNSAVSHLIFAGLLKYDQNNQLTGDLASDWQVDKTGEIYTVHLRPDVKWSDGQPVTASDVVFTYQVIENPDADSPFTAGWQNVTVTSTDDRTIVFTLPNPLSSFPYSLTTGIIPKHVLGNVPMDQMRSVAFNTTAPIGAGPFKFESVQVDSDSSGKQQQAVELIASQNYHWGKPKLDRIFIHAFSNEKQMIHSFKNQEINAMAGLSSVPQEMTKDNAIIKYDIPLTAATDVFFKTGSGVLADAKVRQALVSGTDTGTIIKNAGFIATPVNEALLKNQLGYDPKYQQLPFNPAKAMLGLDADGWAVGADGYRYNKTGQQLTFGLYTPNTDEYSRIARELQEQWKQIGVKVDLHLQDSSDFNATLAYHSYDALLYSISIGVDPDVFVYWDSTQADVRSPTRLNFSEYKSATADASLEAGRTRTEPALRAIKYQPFLKDWQQDAPAVGLYQPRFLYITHTKVFGLDSNPINNDANRFDNVQNWMINEAPQTIKSQ
ncbi:MAG TPA: peptide ABC transporter substrate-binding protein [Candidatus Saccharimonadales bacterium]|nr:peptide ABC transporter substrate-binding protein [Candidatus Saccharimonadales bacterium]